MSTYQATYNASNRIHRSPSAKMSYSPGHWKNYIVNDFVPPKDNRTSRDSLSQRALSPSNSINQINYPQNNYYDEKQKKKEEMMKRVKQIQSRVMPLIENENHNKYEQEVGWQAKLQQRISKLETAVDAIQKQMDIKMQRHIVELQKRLSDKIKDLEAKK